MNMVGGPVRGVNEVILPAIERRRAARARKDFVEADNVRNDLKKIGIYLKDKPDGTTEWSYWE